jgi:hypothetical protein
MVINLSYVIESKNISFMKDLTTVRVLGPLSLLFVALAFTSCAEELKTSPMSVKFINANSGKNQSIQGVEYVQRDLTLLNAIYLDVIQCEVHYSSPAGFEGWHALPTHPGIYNLLDVDTDATIVLVHDTLMPHGDITQYRLILGPNNTIDIGGTIYPLKVPSAEQSGLKIDLKDHINFATGIEVVLAFDPFHSIVEQGNGGYILKPVIQVDIVNQF